jgi:hypothetical protein
MSDDDDFEEFADIQFERLFLGRYVVAGKVIVNGKAQIRRVECINPAYGFLRLEEQIAALLCGGRDETAAQARADDRGASGLGIGPKSKRRRATNARLPKADHCWRRSG